MIPSTKAAILVAQHRPLVIDEVRLPSALGVGQVLVRVHYSGLCGSQLGEIDGVKGDDPHLPHLLGHEGSGTVIEAGAGVRHVRPGDRVVLHWRPGAGIDAEPPVYEWQGGRLNAGWVTTFNEHAVVSENRLTPIPADFDLAQAALFGCPVTTGLGVVTRDARLTLGESIVVIGAGGVGLSVVQGAVLVSAAPIVAVDRHAAKLELARRLGARHGIRTEGEGDGRQETGDRSQKTGDRSQKTGDRRQEAGDSSQDAKDVARAVRAVVGSRGADVVVENTGDAAMIALAYELTAPEGRTVLVGVPRADRPASLHTLPLHFGKTLTGSHGGSARPAEDIPRYVRLCAAGALDLAPLITDRIQLDDINAAIDRLRRGEIVGRCVIELSAARPPQ
jgi:S-(hydroxymethyl)glutathione dehydrogenase/alcohol dehydrogenase